MVSGLNLDNFINKAFLTPEELAEVLSVSKPTIYRMLDKRELTCYKVGGSLRFFKKDIESYLNEVRINPMKM